MQKTLPFTQWLSSRFNSKLLPVMGIMIGVIFAIDLLMTYSEHRESFQREMKSIAELQAKNLNLSDYSTAFEYVASYQGRNSITSIALVDNQDFLIGASGSGSRKQESLRAFAKKFTDEFNLKWQWFENIQKLGFSQQIRGRGEALLGTIVGEIDLFAWFYSPLQRIALILTLNLVLYAVVYSLIVRTSRDAATPLLDLTAFLSSKSPVMEDALLSKIPVEEQRLLAEKLIAFRKEADSILELREEHAKYLAIANTTQMLAHDIRKPFSIIKLGMQMIERQKEDPASLYETYRSFAMEATKAMTWVEGLLLDIMEIGRTNPVDLDTHSPVSIIKSALSEVFRFADSDRIEFYFQLDHTHNVRVDSVRVMRAFINILDNARQAMRGIGRIEVQTQEVASGEEKFLRISLTNSGTFIPEEKRHKIFEIFYTEGKKNGTGLGLAIAKKIIESQGGSIHCESSMKNGTSFIFTLPLDPDSKDKHLGQPHMPKDARSIAKEFADAKRLQDGSEISPVERRIHDLFPELEKSFSTENKPLRILLVDDEKLYADAIVNLISPNYRFKEKLNFICAADAEEAQQKYKEHGCDLLICDLDLGPNSPDGFSLTFRLREMGYKGFVCIHSNHSYPDIHDKAILYGGNFFLPKPMGLDFFLELLARAVKRGSTTLNPPKSKFETPQGLRVAFIEDNTFIREAWVGASQNVRIEGFASPAAFMDALNNDPSLAKQYQIIVTDYYFDDSVTGETSNCLEFVKTLRGLGDFKIYLASDASLKDEEKKLFDAILSKDIPADEIFLAETMNKDKSA